MEKIVYDPSEAAFTMAMADAKYGIKALRLELETEEQANARHIQKRNNGIATDLFTGGPLQRWTLRFDD